MRRGSSIWISLDWWTVALYAILVTQGWFTIYAANFDGLHTDFLDLTREHGKQILWISVSLVLGILILITDSKFYTTFAYFIYGLVILLLIAVLLFGTEIKGSRSWFTIAGFSLQPSEFAKFATCLAVAKYLGSLTTRMRDFSAKIIAMAIFCLPAGLILMQGDTGSALVFASFVLVLYRDGLPTGVLLSGLLLGVLSILSLLISKFILVGALLVLGVGLAYYARKNTGAVMAIIITVILSQGYVFSVDYVFNDILRPHQQERINELLGKQSDPQGAGYNVNQSKIAIGSGGLTGKGYLNGTQTKYDFVPEQSTDFIFCTIGEEHGFIGSFVVLGLFFGLLLRIIFLAERQRSKFTMLYAYGVASVLFFHITVNIGMTIGLAPVIGIPFPFFSYGGSSIISFTILLFILLKLDSDRLAVLR